MNTSLNDSSKQIGSKNFFASLFTKIVKVLFPIGKQEIKKFLPMAAMMFIILFNYNIVRTLKDILIVNDGGAEVINFLKPFVVLPASFIFVILYSKISNTFSKTNVFYVSVIPFILFNVLFAYFLYPNVSWLHPNPDKVAALQAAYPRFKAIFPVYGLWTYSMFYTFSEMWGVVGMNLLFWQFANRVVSVEESKRFYTSFGLVGNIGFLLASVMLQSILKSGKSGAAFAVNLVKTMKIVILLSLVLVAIYWLFNKYVLSQQECQEVAPKKKKAKPTLGQSFKTVFSSKYLGYIMLLIFCYNAMINLVEVTWKQQVSIYAESLGGDKKTNYGLFISKTNMVMAAFSMVLFPTSSFLSRKFKWSISASITPFIMVPTAILFFLFTVYPSMAMPLTVLFPAFTPLFMAVVLGAVQNIGSKSTKYALFDPTKEMTYVPLLDEELKSKGKAAVDVAGSRISKSFGSAVQAFLIFALSSSQLGIAPYVMAIIAIIGSIWFITIRLLSKEYTKAVATKEEFDAEAAKLKESGCSPEELDALRAKFIEKSST